MKTRFTTITRILAAIALAASTIVAFASPQDDDSNYCMIMEIEPFHLMPDGSCTVRDYFGGELQERFYPFTELVYLVKQFVTY